MALRRDRSWLQCYFADILKKLPGLHKRRKTKAHRETVQHRAILCHSLVVFMAISSRRRKICSSQPLAQCLRISRCCVRLARCLNNQAQSNVCAVAMLKARHRASARSSLTESRAACADLNDRGGVALYASRYFAAPWHRRW